MVLHVPGGATAALCLCALTHTYLLFSIFPYAGYMTVYLLPGRLTVDTTGLFAGLLGAAFTLGRSLGFGPWRSVRSAVGRTSSLQLSLFLSAIFSACFGFSTTFGGAVASRFLLGLSNGISGAVKGAARDHARARAEVGEDVNEERIPARLLQVMSWGCALGPALGGVLADPLGHYPLGPGDVDVPTEGWLLDRYPYVLPNLAGTLLCVLSMITVKMFVEDLSGTSKRWESACDAFCKLMRRRTGEGKPLLPSKNGDEGEEGVIKRIDGGHMSAMAKVWKEKNTCTHIMVYWYFSFVVVLIEEATPLFLIARAAGPGVSESSLGWVLCGAGLFQAVCRAEWLFEIIGLYPSLRLGALLGTAPAALLPLALVLNGGTYDELETSGGILGVTWSAYAFLVIVLGSLKVFATLFFAVMGIAVGRTAPPARRDDAARVMTLGALYARAAAPAVAGCLTYLSLSATHLGSVILWCVIGLQFGLLAAALAFTVLGPNPGDGTKGQREQRRSLYLEERQKHPLYVALWETNDRKTNTPGARWRRATRKVVALTSFTRGGFTNEDRSSVSTDDAITDKMEKRISWSDHTITTPGSEDLDSVSFFILGTHKNDELAKPHVLSPPLMNALSRHMPPSCFETNFWLKYSLVRDGASLETLERLTCLSKYTVLAIETLDGQVFGSFNSKPWRKTNHTYIGGGESFLWRMRERRSMEPPESVEKHAHQEGSIDVYRWTGENDLCQLLTEEKIAIGGGGGGFGITMDEDLFKGMSSPCATYGNPSLCQDGEFFEVANVEVWAMTPFLFVADAERSEHTVRFAEENTITGQGAWSNFL